MCANLDAENYPGDFPFFTRCGWSPCHRRAPSRFVTTIATHTLDRQIEESLAVMAFSA